MIFENKASGDSFGAPLALTSSADYAIGIFTTLSIIRVRETLKIL
jgi:hypothetical protein